MTYQPEADQFLFNFDAIVDRLSPILRLDEHPIRERATVVFHRGNH